MENKYIIFFNNGIADKLEPFYQKIKNNLPCKTVFVSYEDLKSDYITNILKTRKAAESILVIDSAFYAGAAEAMHAYLFSLYSVRFTNIILLCRDPYYPIDRQTIDGEKYCFPFTPDLDLELQAAYFIIYAVNLFEKAVIADRLNDYICNSFREVVYSELLAKKAKGIKKLNDELESENKIDHLTRLFNKNGLLYFLKNERKRTIRDLWRLEHSILANPKKKHKNATLLFPHKPAGTLNEHFGIFALIIIEIAAFEEINNTYGFLKGDEVLITIARLFQDSGILRENDITGRFGGGKFFILLPETSAHNALIPAERFLEAVKTREMHDGENKFFVSLSIGISQFHTDDVSDEAIIQRTMEALEQARHKGLDKIVVYEPKNNDF